MGSVKVECKDSESVDALDECGAEDGGDDVLESGSLKELGVEAAELVLVGAGERVSEDRGA